MRSLRARAVRITRAGARWSRQPSPVASTALLLLAACSRDTPPRSTAPPPLPCPETWLTPADKQPAPASAPAPSCVDELPALSSCGLRPGVEAGGSTICAAACVDGSSAVNAGGAARCRSPRLRRFASCDASTLARAITVAAFLAPGAPRTGELVNVRGRLGPGGLHATGKATPVGLIGDRGESGICILAHLMPKAGEASDRWLCSPPVPGESSSPCCDEDSSRPAVGEEIVVRAKVLRVLIGTPVALFGAVDLEPDTLCVVGRPR